MSNPADWLLQNLKYEYGESSDSPKPACLARNTKPSQLKIKSDYLFKCDISLSLIKRKNLRMEVLINTIFT